MSDEHFGKIENYLKVIFWISLKFLLKINANGMEDASFSLQVHPKLRINPFL
jgi:hypothetical protein